MKKIRTEGELPGDVGLKISRAVNRTAGREEQMLMFGEINDGSHIERGIVPATGLHGGAVVNFAADQNVVPDLALEHRAAKAPVLISRAWIDAVATAAVNRPVAETFLEPQRQERLPLSAAQTARAVASRGFDQGEHRGFREQGGFPEPERFSLKE